MPKTRGQRANPFGVQPCDSLGETGVRVHQLGRSGKSMDGSGAVGLRFCRGKEPEYDSAVFFFTGR